MAAMFGVMFRLQCFVAQPGLLSHGCYAAGSEVGDVWSRRVAQQLPSQTWQFQALKRKSSDPPPMHVQASHQTATSPGTRKVILSSITCPPSRLRMQLGQLEVDQTVRDAWDDDWLENHKKDDIPTTRWEKLPMFIWGPCWEY